MSEPSACFRRGKLASLRRRKLTLALADALGFDVVEEAVRRIGLSVAESRGAEE